METLKKLYNTFSKVEKYCIFGVFFFATISVVINVLGRKLIGFSFNWLEELNRYILVACTFVGASIAVTEGIHPKMDSVVGLFKGRAHLVVIALSTLIFTAFSIIMTYYAVIQLKNMMIISAVTATLKVPVYVFFAFIPIGFFGMSVHSIINLIFKIKDIKDYKIGRMNEVVAEEGGGEV